MGDDVIASGSDSGSSGSDVTKYQCDLTDSGSGGVNISIESTTVVITRDLVDGNTMLRIEGKASLQIYQVEIQVA